MATEMTPEDTKEQEAIQDAMRTLEKAGIHLPNVGPVTAEEIAKAESELKDGKA